MALTTKESCCSGKSSCWQPLGRCLKTNVFMILTLLGIVFGFAIGLLVRRYTSPSEDFLLWLGMPGDVFLRLLKVTIVPLITTAIISSTASLDPKANGKVGIVATTYFLSSNFMGAVLGVLLTIAIRPGRGVFNVGNSETKEVSSLLSPTDILIDLIRNIFPDNIIRATLQKSQTEYTQVSQIIESNTSEGLQNLTIIKDLPKLSYVDTTNILGLLCFCIVLGLATGFAEEKGKPFLNFVDSLQSVVLIVVKWLLWITPLGICSLIAVSISQVEDIVGVFTKLALLVATVVTGCIMQQIVYFPLLHFIVVRSNPFRMLISCPKAWLMAFSGAISMCALPEILGLRDKFRYDKRITNFVIFYSLTIQTAGGSLYQSVAVIFIADLALIDVTASQCCLIIFLLTMQSVAVPNVPHASLVGVVIVLTTLGFPVHDVGTLFAVEWFLDRLRTTSNLVCTLYSLGFINHVCESDSNKDIKDIIQDEDLVENAMEKRKNEDEESKLMPKYKDNQDIEIEIQEI